MILASQFPEWLFYTTIVLLAGVALGLLLAWPDRRKFITRDDLRAEWQAMQATERLSEAAWDARQQMHQSIREARQP